LFALSLVTAMPAAAQVAPGNDALQRVRDSRAARAADQAERTQAVHDMLRPDIALEPVVGSNSAFERQVLVRRSLDSSAHEGSARTPRGVDTQPVDTLLIPQGKPLGRTPPR